MKDLHRRIRERKMVQWVLAYLAGAWLVLQVATLVGQHFQWPVFVLRGLTAVLAVGLLAALVIAWYHGEKGAQRVGAVELLMLGGILVLAAVAVAVVAPAPQEGDVAPESQAGRASPPPMAPRGSIAVLPFVNTSPDRDNEYFSDGMTEELLDALARVEGLRVASRTSAFAFKDRALPVQEIGRALNVETVLEGSVRRAGDRLRITARLTRVDEGYQLWSNSYTRDLRDVFELQEEIAHEIVGALRIRLTGEDSARVGRPTVDLEAYDAYLRGRFLWHRRTRESLLAARDQFRLAVERAPDFARAHLGLADAYAVLGFYDHLPARDAFPPARDAALSALQLDPTLAQARATLGYVALYYDWDWRAAEREFRAAIQLSPDYSVAHQWLANYLVAMGRFEEAVTSMRRAVELDPLSLIASAALGWVHLHAGDQDQAAAQFRRTLELDPTFHLAYLWSGLSLLEAGDTEAALEALRRARELGADDPALTANLALGLARAGQQREAARLLARLHERDGREYLPSLEMARAHLANGDQDRALDWLERAMRERSHSIAFLRVDPFLVPLHHHPRFVRLLNQVGLGAAATAAETSRSSRP